MIFALQIFYVFFGLLTLAGGIMGFVKAQSVISLIAGLVLGAMLLTAAALLSPPRNVALFLGLVASLAVAGKFIPDLITKPTLFPAGLMAVLSAVSVALTIFAWYPR